MVDGSKFSLTGAQPLPTTFSGPLYVKERELVIGGWCEKLIRFIVPAYASCQDKKVSALFLDTLHSYSNKNLNSEGKGRLESILSLAEQHLISQQGGWWSGISAEASRLEHYTLAARKRLNRSDFTAASEAALKEKCRLDNKVLFEKWNQLGFEEDAFWSSPDLVDFIFKNHLHRRMVYPFYRHTICSEWTPSFRNGEREWIREPHLLVDGVSTPWSQISNKLHVDVEQRFYSEEMGQKKYWEYLDQGFTQHDKKDIRDPRYLYKLREIPERSQVVVVTTHAHPAEQFFGDRILKGTRHAFLRLIPGRDFLTRHPEWNLVDGGVYSYGWGTHWRDFSFTFPLTTLTGTWNNPDNWEFLKEDLCCTPIEVTDAKLIAVFESIKKRMSEEKEFHFITANCSGIVAQILEEAGVIELSTKYHMAYMWYKFLVPKCIRRPLSKIGSALNWLIAPPILNGLKIFGSLIYSLLFIPIFSVLGAWRKKVHYEDESTAQSSLAFVRASNRIKALFSNVFDLLDPNKMTFDLTRNIYKKWQQKQPQTYFERHE